MKEPKRGIEPWQIEDAKRLRELFDVKKAEAKRNGERLTQEMLAELAGIPSTAMTWQYLAGHRALNIKSAAGFAKALGVAVGDFSPALAEQIASVAPGVAAAPSAAEDVASSYSLSVEKLLLINAINEKEAAILRRYRMADDESARMIEVAASVARPRGLGVVDNDQAQHGPSRAG